MTEINDYQSILFFKVPLNCTKQWYKAFCENVGREEDWQQFNYFLEKLNQDVLTKSDINDYEKYFHEFTTSEIDDGGLYYEQTLSFLGMIDNVLNHFKSKEKDEMITNFKINFCEIFHFEVVGFQFEAFEYLITNYSNELRHKFFFIKDEFCFEYKTDSFYNYANNWINKLHKDIVANVFDDIHSFIESNDLFLLRYKSVSDFLLRNPRFENQLLSLV